MKEGPATKVLVMGTTALGEAIVLDALVLELARRVAVPFFPTLRDEGKVKSIEIGVDSTLVAWESNQMLALRISRWAAAYLDEDISGSRVPTNDVVKRRAANR